MSPGVEPADRETPGAHPALPRAGQRPSTRHDALVPAVGADRRCGPATDSGLSGHLVEVSSVGHGLTMLAKVSAPQLSRILVRPRLLRRLDGAARAGVIWLAGPPGAGKTTLVASWLASRRTRHLWMQLDPGDGDVASFFHYLAIAAAAAGIPALPAFTPESLASPGDFARRFFRAIWSGRRRPITVVLDDYHEVHRASALHGALRDGLAELTPGASVVIISRGEPPPPMARWAARGKLALVRGEELTLTVREAARVARLWRRPGREVESVAALHARTEGWVAGLVLLLAGRGGSGPLRGEESLFDYFAEEVLARAAPETQRLLLETALLPRVDARTAARLTGLGRAGELLADLARQGQFVTRHDAPETTFQCHALFREFLRRRAERVLRPERLSELRRTAAATLTEAGAGEDAIDLYLGAAAWPEASGVIRGCAQALLAEGRADTVARWIEAVPEPERARDPWLLLWLGAARAVRDPAEARRHLERAFELLRREGDERGVYLAWALAAETYLFELDDLAPLDRWIAALDELRAAFPASPGPELEARLAGVAFGALMNRQPWHPGLPDFEERALTLALGLNDTPARLALGYGLALFYGWWAMDLARARLLLETLGPLAAKGEPAAAIFWCMAEANADLHQSRLQECSAAIERGLAIASGSGVPRWNAFLHALEVWAALATGDLARAAKALAPMRGAGPAESRLARCMYHGAAGMVARARGEDAIAREHGRAGTALAAAAGFPLVEAAARTAAALAAPDREAEAELGDSLAFARRCHFPSGQVGCLLGLALLHLRRGDEPRLRAALEEGFSIARRLAWRNVFWLGRQELSACCAAALERGVEPELARQIIGSLRLGPPAHAEALEAWPWEIRIEALGGLDIRRDGALLPRGRKAQKKPLELLRLLVARGPGGVRQEVLAEALWPDSDGDAAQRALKTTVYRLRKLLGSGDAVSHHVGRVALDPRSAFVDAWAVSRLLDRGAGHEEPVDPLRERVRNLYRGDLFGPDGDAPDVVLARDALRERVRRFLEP